MSLPFGGEWMDVDISGNLAYKGVILKRGVEKVSVRGESCGQRIHNNHQWK